MKFLVNYIKTYLDRDLFAIIASMKKDLKKIAIVRLSALGDIINSAVVLQFIKQFYPSVQVDWICEEMFQNALESAFHLDTIHSVNIKKIKKEKSFSLLIQTIKELKSLDDYDIVIDMQGLIKSAIVARLIGKNTHGFDKNSTRESLAALFYKTTSSIPYETCVVERNSFVVGDALDFTITQEMLVNKQPVFRQTQTFAFKKDKKNIGFVIGASWESKIYPKELVVKVCDLLMERCYIIWGNAKEKEDALWICKHSKHAELAPKMTLGGLISYISQLDLVIGNDTGPTHIAWAQNIPSITLFGPTNERMIYQTQKNIAIKSPSKVNILKIDKNDFSIREIPYEKVVQKAKELLC